MADVVNPVLLRYATALYQLVSAGGAGAVATAGGQLDALAHNVAHNEELRIHLASPRLGRESKRRLLSHVLGAQTGDAVRRTVMLLVDKGRASEVGGLAGLLLHAFSQAAGSVVPPVPNSRSNTARGSLAIGNGVVALLQHSVLAYAQA